MTTIGPIDQAVLLLRDKLQRLNAMTGAALGQAAAAQGTESDPIQRLRVLQQQGRLNSEELRKAFVRTMLSDAFGEAVASSLQFQEISEAVVKTILSNEHTVALLDKALAEWGLRPISPFLDN
jgi:hypothetical protein